MNRTLTIVLSFVFFGTCTVLFAQDAMPAAMETAIVAYGPQFQAETKDQPTNEIFKGLAVEKKFIRRLPNHYKDVITDEQRDRIYEIQKQYFGVIELLTVRLEKLKTERDAQIEAVLTADQKAQIAALEKESAAKREATRKAGAAAVAK